VAHRNKVILSVNGPDGVLCVDVFRRDPEDNRGWYSIGHHGSLRFATEEETRAEAKETINWFAEL
jgi:hypothetical protein